MHIPSSEALLEHGLWDNVRFDKGRENVLAAFVQALLADLRCHQDRPPYSMVSSTSNTRVERQWVEINARLTKDIKHILINMEEDGLIQAGSDGNPVHIFAVSTVTIPIINLRAERFLSAFRLRRINGSRGCIPDRIRRHNNQITCISEEDVPTTDEAISLYRQSGGHLTDQRGAGEDPLKNYPDLWTRRSVIFEKEAPSIEDIVADLNNGNGRLLAQSIMYFLELTMVLKETILI
jgi:hypothetical protein